MDTINRYKSSVFGFPVKTRKCRDTRLIRVEKQLNWGLCTELTFVSGKGS